MSLISHFTSPPPEALKSQILQMVVDYLTDISSMAIAPSNPLYNLYQYGIGYEVHLYLEALAGGQGVNVELLLACDPDDPEQVLGFALYLPAADDPQACAVAYLAIQASHRRRGIARMLLAEVTARYPHTELNCVVAKVPWFERLGFQVVGAKGPQVKLSTHAKPIDSLVAVLDVAPIYSSLEVRQIHAYLLNQHGRKAMIEAEKKRDRQLDQMTRQATTFVRDRLGH